MVRIAAQCEDSIGELRRFTGLRQRINDVVIEFLRTRLDPTQQMIESIVGMELAYINTNHPDFVGGQEGPSRLNSSSHAYYAEFFFSCAWRSMASAGYRVS
jgi:dynamin 1-like protein